MYKVSHLTRAHGKALNDQPTMSLVLVSNHEILLYLSLIKVIANSVYANLALE